MKQSRTPQEKKQLSYARDCRNWYGENDKASRKTIRFRKRYVHKSYRKAIKQQLAQPEAVLETHEANDLENKVLAIKQKHWQKLSDMPLGEYVLRQQKRRK